MLRGLDYTVHLSIWRHCRIVSNEQIVIVTFSVNIHAVPGRVSDLSATSGVFQITMA